MAKNSSQKNLNPRRNHGAGPGGPASQASGAIEPSVLYTLDDVKQRLGFGDHSLRIARSEGLKVHRRHNRAFVLGSDIIRYITGNES